MPRVANVDGIDLATSIFISGPTEVSFEVFDEDVGEWRKLWSSHISEENFELVKMSFPVDPPVAVTQVRLKSSILRNPTFSCPGSFITVALRTSSTGTVKIASESAIYATAAEVFSVTSPEILLNAKESMEFSAPELNILNDQTTLHATGELTALTGSASLSATDDLIVSTTGLMEISSAEFILDVVDDAYLSAAGVVSVESQNASFVANENAFIGAQSVSVVADDTADVFAQNQMTVASNTLDVSVDNDVNIAAGGKLDVLAAEIEVSTTDTYLSTGDMTVRSTGQLDMHVTDLIEVVTVGLEVDASTLDLTVQQEIDITSGTGIQLSLIHI